ncbi:PcfJ domain-containing protein [Pseudomonas aeruginosa]
MAAPSEKHLYMANLWAQHFTTAEVEREAFVANYIKRCQEHRFWCVSAAVDGRVVVAARMEDFVLVLDRGRIWPISLKDGKYSEGVRVRLPQKVPKAAVAVSVMRRLVEAAARCAGRFSDWCPDHNENADYLPKALTTFSKEYRSLVSRAMSRDIGHYLNEGPSKDRRYTSFRRPYYAKLAATVMKQFWVHLDADALRACRSVGCPSIALYNWIVRGDAARRIQAVQAFPVLLPGLVLMAQRAGCLDTSAVGPAVDAGNPLLPVLTRTCQQSESLVRQMGKLRPSMVGSALRQIGTGGWHQPYEWLWIGLSLGNRRPTSKLGWTNWRSLFDALPDCYFRYSYPMSGFLAGMPDWESEEWGELVGRAQDVRDLRLDECFRFGRGEAPSWTLRQLLNVSSEWHQVRDRIARALAERDVVDGMPKEMPWPGLLRADVLHPDTGIVISELIRPSELAVEGQAMRHCVGGYSNVCYEGRSRILSLRKDGVSIATVELRLRQRTGRPSVRDIYCEQLRGRANAHVPPDSDAGRAFAWLQRSIQSWKIRVAVDWEPVPHNLRPVSTGQRDRFIFKAMKRWLTRRGRVALPEKRAVPKGRSRQERARAA